MTHCPFSVPQHVVLPEPPASSLPHVPHPESDLARAASPTVTRLLATVVTDPDFESTTAFTLVTELVDFAARSRLHYVASLVTESESVCPLSVAGEPALSSDVLEDKHFELECLTTALPRFTSMLFCPEGDSDALDIPSPCSYAKAIAVSRPFVVGDSVAVFHITVPRLLGFVGAGSHSQLMTTLRVLLHVAAQRDYELLFLDFFTAFSQGSLHEEIWLRRPPGLTASTTLVALGFARSTADPSLFLRTDTTLPPFYVLVYVLHRFGFQFSLPQPPPLSTSHLLSAPPLDEFVEPSGPYPELVGCLMYLTKCTRPDLAYPLSLVARFVAPVHQAYGSYLEDGVQCLGSGSVSWRSTRSAFVLGSICEAEIYAGAMAAQELSWLTYLLTDLGERPRL
ncbi:unnamed protein product [Closterium sp. NIES-53]